MIIISCILTVADGGSMTFTML